MDRTEWLALWNRVLQKTITARFGVLSAMLWKVHNFIVCDALSSSEQFLAFGRIILRSSSSIRRSLVYVHRHFGRTCSTLFYLDAGGCGFCLRRRFVSQRLRDITSQKTVVSRNKSDKIYRGILEFYRIYIGHFKSSAHCACAAGRMMQSFWFSRQLWARLQ